MAPCCNVWNEALIRPITRSGAVVDNLLIFGRDDSEAERKLRQMYMGCEILEKRNVACGPARSGPVNYEDVVDLISGH